MNDIKLFPMLYNTRPVDAPLFAELDLAPFLGAPHSERIEIGTVHMPAGKVKIEVTCLPAQFWRFHLFPSENDDGQRIILRTGSGSLSEYWPSIVMFLQGMLVAEEFPEEPAQ